MATWLTCTTNDGVEVRLNADHVAVIRPYHSDRGFTGSEIVFAGGAPSSIVVQETPDALTGAPSPQQI
jgi:hypothetical protein